MHPEQVAIALPVYNGDDYLRETLLSFQKQTYPYFELIICDNASTDSTADIAIEFAETDKRFIYSQQNEHVDGLKNFNRAYRLTDGRRKYFIWACDDNIWAPSFLEKTVNYMENHSECTLCGVYLHHFRDSGEIYYRNYNHVPWYFKKFRLLQLGLERKVGYSIYGMMRRSALDSIKFEFDCRCYIDTWIVLQLRALGTIHVIEEDLLSFRSGGLSSTKDDPYVARINDLIFSETELNILLAIKNLSLLEKMVWAQKMVYYALRHNKPETVKRWWLFPAYFLANKYPNWKF